MVDGVIWDHEAVGSSPATRTTMCISHSYLLSFLFGRKAQ